MDFSPHQHRHAQVWAAVAAVTALATSDVQALTITPYFGASITGAKNAAAIESSINTALAYYSSTFNNNETVSVVFQTGRTSLGSSAGTFYLDDYGDYSSQIAADSVADPQNTVLAGALAHVSLGAQPSGGNVYADSANLRAIGDAWAGGWFGSNGVFGDGNYDGVITLSNLVAANGDPRINYGGPVLGDEYAALGVIEHEVDEILGIGGAGTVLGTSYLAAGDVGSLDVYRYSAPGTPSLKTGKTVSAYLSLDGGVTDLHAFNQSGLGDYGDWAKTDVANGCAPATRTAPAAPQFVQDFSACPGAAFATSLTATSPELIALQAVGYDEGAPQLPAMKSRALDAAGQVGVAMAGLDVPEPGTWSLLALGLGLAGWAAPSGRRAVAPQPA